jgi:hypothetical protein
MYKTWVSIMKISVFIRVYFTQQIDKTIVGPFIDLYSTKENGLTMQLLIAISFSSWINYSFESFFVISLAIF